ncbi:pro-sigmaK processing inhibitor BofA family protein [Bacillus sp. PS06]|uniref:pro-sigmaK processing inhibitor BofA family protein n=1 Tax=Bacillus sp. PS06 TaxID=2764176 RepID=UPI00177C7FAC|nr:pro-sigmaK processing inhibitor BofA family protein [Bacillus sp. PS06]MBD8071523.1 pro-sigmaK processing inhibitor BofA family protein [Bacillus sp. PS06]
MEPIIVISIVGVLVLLLLLVGAPIKPIRLIGQGVVKIMIGALLLFFLNAFGSTLGLHVPINLVTSTISGLLGLPGLAALVVIERFIL